MPVSFCKKFLFRQLENHCNIVFVELFYVRVEEGAFAFTNNNGLANDFRLAKMYRKDVVVVPDKLYSVILNYAIHLILFCIYHIFQMEGKVDMVMAEDTMSIKGGLSGLRIDACPYNPSNRKGKSLKVRISRNSREWYIIMYGYHNCR